MQGEFLFANQVYWNDLTSFLFNFGQPISIERYYENVVLHYDKSFFKYCKFNWNVLYIDKLK